MEDTLLDQCLRGRPMGNLLVQRVGPHVLLELCVLTQVSRVLHLDDSSRGLSMFSGYTPPSAVPGCPAQLSMQGECFLESLSASWTIDSWETTMVTRYVRSTSSWRSGLWLKWYSSEFFLAGLGRLGEMGVSSMTFGVFSLSAMMRLSFCTISPVCQSYSVLVEQEQIE
jgi:hypothetical protein